MGDDDQVYDLNVVAFPTTYLVTRDMKVFRRYIGAGPRKAAEVEAETRLLSGLEPVQAGTRAYVRFLLRDPLLLLPGDRFIVRMFSPVLTIGGGLVLDIAAPPKMRTRIPSRIPERWPSRIQRACCLIRFRFFLGHNPQILGFIIT